MMGRPPKPERDHRRDGTFRADRHAGVDPACGEPECPDWLDEDARWLWDCIANGMAGHKAPDSPLLVGLCRWWSLWRRWDRLLETGEYDPYKATCMAGAAWKQVLATSSKLGISITDRMKLRQLGESKELPSDKDRFFGVAG